MDQERRQLAQGHKDEAALVQARMGHGQPCFIDDAFAVEEDVEVDGPRPGTVILVAAQRPLDLSITENMP